MTCKMHCHYHVCENYVCLYWMHKAKLHLSIDSEEVGHDHMHYFIVWKLPYISLYASRGLIVINSGMIVVITTTSIKN